VSPAEVASPQRGWSRIPTVAYFFALTIAVFTLGALLTWRPLSGRYDFWAHAAVGQWVCENGRPPDRTLFQWTSDEPWVYHSWLSQVVFYSLTRIGAAESLPEIVLGFTALLAMAPFALIWYLWYVRAGLSCWMALPFVFALDGTAHRLQTRPELFTGLFLTLLLAYLSRSAALTRRWIDVGLVLVGFTIWGNFHGAVIIGILTLCVTAVCDFLQNRRDGRWKHTAFLAVLATLAVSVNPYGISYWLALEPVGSNRFARIYEWFPIWRNPRLSDETILAAVVLPVLATAAWAFNPNRRWAQLVWLVMFAGMFVMARRNVWPFTLACLVVLATNAGSIAPMALWSRLSRWMSKHNRALPPPPFLRWVFRAAVLIFVVLRVWAIPADFVPREFFVPVRLEAGIVRYVKENRLQGRVFNDYENSSYLQWRFSGQPALYIDLLNAYPLQVMDDYSDLVLANDRGRRLLDEQGIEIVILTTNRGAVGSLGNLADYLDAKPEWARVYAGHDGVIWVRRIPAFEYLWSNPKGPYRSVKFAILEKWGEDSFINLPAPVEIDK
jgi:hypothetical protein